MNANNPDEVLARLSAIGVVPVVRTKSQDLAYRAIQVLAETGFRTVEITMTVPGAVELLQELAHSTDLILGAGTILSSEEAKASIQAGADYVVSPCIVEDVADVCSDAGIPFIMAGLTPTEIMAAWKMGSAAVKVFPAQAVNGPDYLKSVKAVYPFIPLVPTGGVNLGNLGAYLRAGAAFVGAGSDLVNVSLLEADPSALRQLGRQYLQAVADARKGG